MAIGNNNGGGVEYEVEPSSGGGGLMSPSEIWELLRLWLGRL